MSAIASRYSRQELFAGIGPRGPGAHPRRRASRSSGCGALGSRLAEMMVRAGVGALTVVDRDFVEPVEPAAAVALRRGGRRARACPRRWRRERAAARASTPTSRVRGVVADLVRRQRGRAAGRRRPRARRHRQLRDALPAQRRLRARRRPLGLRRLRGLVRPGAAVRPARHALPALRAGGACPPPGSGPDLRHRRRRRAHRARGRGHPGRGGAEAAGRPHRVAAARPRHRGPVAGHVRGDGPARPRALVPGLHRGPLRLRRGARRRRPPCCAAATRCSSAPPRGTRVDLPRAGRAPAPPWATVRRQRVPGALPRRRTPSWSSSRTAAPS